MTQGARSSTIRRKVASAAAPAPIGAMTLERAWRLALVHGLSGAAGLAVTLDSLSGRDVEPIDMGALMDTGDLAILLEGPNGFGVALFDVQMMAGLLEAQTMGRVLARPAQPRTPTPTDGAMIANPLDRVLTLFETHGQGVAGADLCFGLRYATMLTDGRTVMLALPDESHLLSEFIMVLGAGERRGRLRLILPRALPPKADTTDTGPEWNAQLEQNLMGATATLQAVLTRLQLPIEVITGLAKGDLVPVPATALGRVALSTCTGTVIAQGRLGQKTGMKAILLDGMPEPSPAALPLPEAGE